MAPTPSMRYELKLALQRSLQRRLAKFRKLVYVPIILSLPSRSVPKVTFMDLPPEIREKIFHLVFEERLGRGPKEPKLCVSGVPPMPEQRLSSIDPMLKRGNFKLGSLLMYTIELSTDFSALETVRHFLHHRNRMPSGTITPLLLNKACHQEAKHVLYRRFEFLFVLRATSSISGFIPMNLGYPKTKCVLLTEGFLNSIGQQARNLIQDVQISIVIPEILIPFGAAGYPIQVLRDNGWAHWEHICGKLVVELPSLRNVTFCVSPPNVDRILEERGRISGRVATIKRIVNLAMIFDHNTSIRCGLRDGDSCNTPWNHLFIAECQSLLDIEQRRRQQLREHARFKSQTALRLHRQRQADERTVQLLRDVNRAKEILAELVEAREEGDRLEEDIKQGQAEIDELFAALAVPDPMEVRDNAERDEAEQAGEIGSSTNQKDEVLEEDGDDGDKGGKGGNGYDSDGSFDSYNSYNNYNAYNGNDNNDGYDGYGNDDGYNDNNNNDNNDGYNGYYDDGYYGDGYYDDGEYAGYDNTYGYDGNNSDETAL